MASVETTRDTLAAREGSKAGWPDCAAALVRIPIICAALIAALPATARAGEPSARDLADLAPVLDSSDGRRRSLDVGGYFGEEKDPAAPRLKFRALYRAPDRSSFLISDAADGTPLIFCSGRKMFVYDPVGPVIFYSEDASFGVKFRRTADKLEFSYTFLLKRNNKENSISVDLRSVMTGEWRDAEGGPSVDDIVATGGNTYRLSRSLNDGGMFYSRLDLGRKFPYESAAFAFRGSVVLGLDRIALDGVLDDGAFSFPSKGRLTRKLPVRDVTREEDPAKVLDIVSVATRAAVVRSVVNRSKSPEALKIPGLSGVDWDRVKENDEKLSKALKEFVPPSLQSW
jgi:hypothetical protein